MATTHKRVRRTARRASKKPPNVHDRLQACIQRERQRPAPKFANPPAADRVLLTLTEAADRLRLSPWTLRSWVHANQIDFTRIGRAGRIMIGKDVIDREIAKGDVIATAAA
jgi:excisionase family DNA binding protein